MSAAREVAARLALLLVQHRSLLQLAAARHGGGLATAAPIAPSSSSPVSSRFPPPTIAAAAAATRSLSFFLSSSNSSSSSAQAAAAAAAGPQHQSSATTITTTTAASSDAHRRAYASSSSSSSTALRPHATAPRPLPRVRRLREGFTWRRMVVRVPPEVSVELVEDGPRGSGKAGAAAAAAAASEDARRRRLVLSGRAGRLELDLSHLDPTGLVAMQLWKRPGGAGSESAGGAEGGKGGKDAAAAAAADPSASSASGGALLLCASPDRRCFRGIATHVDNAVRGVTQGYLQGVAVKGVGYRLEPYFEDGPGGGGGGGGKDAKAATPAAAPAAGSKRRLFWEPPPVLEGTGGGGGGGGGGKNARSVGVAVGPAVTYPVTRPASAVRMKVGFKAAAVVRLPPGVRAFFVRPTLAYLYGADRAAVGNAAASLRAVRPPNAYTGNGVQLVGEEIKLRQRAGAK